MKTNMINAIALNTGVTKADIERVLGALATYTQQEVGKGASVSIPGIVKLVVVKRQARVGRNPKTGQEMHIAAKQAVKLSALKQLKDAVK